MNLRSPAFINNEYLPKEYTCDGADVNPPLTITGAPKEAKSLVLIFVDLDALMGVWTHWLLYNINPTVAEIKTNGIPAGALAGLTSFASTAYGGPCPTIGIHRYIFKLYALDAKLSLPPGPDKEKLENAMSGHVLEQAQLISLYRRDN